MAEQAPRRASASRPHNVPTGSLPLDGPIRAPLDPLVDGPEERA